MSFGNKLGVGSPRPLLRGLFVYLAFGWIGHEVHDRTNPSRLVTEESDGDPGREMTHAGGLQGARAPGFQVHCRVNIFSEAER